MPAGGSLSFSLWIPCQVCLLFSLLLHNKLRLWIPCQYLVLPSPDPPWTAVALTAWPSEKDWAFHQHSALCQHATTAYENDADTECSTSLLCETLTSPSSCIALMKGTLHHPLSNGHHHSA